MKNQAYKYKIGDRVKFILWSGLGFSSEIGMIINSDSNHHWFTVEWSNGITNYFNKYDLVLPLD